MFATLSDRLTSTFKNLRTKGRLSEADIDATVREIRRALLDADVAVPVVRSFTGAVRERALSADGARWVIGCDEVGRGALAGPVGVGLCVVDISRRVPKGLRDSKLLSEPKRVELEPVVSRWALWSSVGMASNEEIDADGLTAALGIAGMRAFDALCASGFEVAESVLLLDGKFDWFTPGARAAGLAEAPPVHMRIKADMTCASVSGASVLAKVARDTLMIGHHDTHPHYGWVSNKGYGSAAHWAAINERGATPLHRHSWLRTPSLFDDAFETEALS